MTTYASRALEMEGVTVVGEAARSVPAESAEFLIEITASAPTAAQALHDNQMKLAQVTQAVAPLGVQPADLQTISLNVYNLYAPVTAFGGMQQIGMPQMGTVPGTGVFPPHAAGSRAGQPEIQASACH